MIDSCDLYNVYRRDRCSRPGGGVITLVLKQLHSHLIPIPERFNDVEVLAVNVISHDGAIRFIVVYRPPEYNLIGREYMKLLCECLKYLFETKDTIIMVGDFNLPCIDWNNFSSPCDDIHSAFFDLCMQSGFIQLVNEPTRGNNCIDLVLTNDQMIVSELSVNEPFSTSDHSKVTFDVVLDTANNTVSNCNLNFFPDFENADFDAIKLLLSNHPFNCDAVFTDSPNKISFTNNVNDVWHKFILPISCAIEMYVPQKRFVSNLSFSSKKRPKYPRHIQRAQNKKLASWKYFKTDKSLLNKTLYSKQADLCKKLIFDFEKTKEQAVLNKSNLGTFYRFINKKLSCRSGVGPLKSTTGQMLLDDSSKSEALNEYFTSVFTTDDGTLPIFPRRVAPNVNLSEVHFSPTAIFKHLKNLKSKHTRDPNGFTTSFLKKLDYVLIKPLCVLFSSIFNNGSIPSD